MYPPGIIHTLNAENIPAVIFYLFCTSPHFVVVLVNSISRSHSELMGSTAKIQKQQQRVRALKSDVISKYLQQTLVSNRSVGMLLLVSVFILVIVKTTKPGDLLKLSLERMLSAQREFLVSVQMQSH